MAKRSWHFDAAPPSTPAVKHSRQKVSERSTLSRCQACTLQIPSFFCSNDCDSKGGLLVKEEPLPPPCLEQQPGGGDGQNHDNAGESYRPANHLYAYHNTSYYTDTDTGADNDTPTTSYESPLTNYEPCPDGCCNYPTYTSYGPPAQPERLDGIESLETGFPGLPYQAPCQLQYSTQTSCPTTECEPSQGVNWSQYNESWPEPTVNQPRAEGRASSHERIRMGCILQDLAQMEAYFGRNTKEQLCAAKDICNG